LGYDKVEKMSDNGYLKIVEHYESCLEKHGDSNLGVDWPREEDTVKRFNAMLGVIKDKKADKISLLDFGCGLSHLYEYLKSIGISNIIYSGLDLSQKFVKRSKKKYPENKYLCVDILKNPEKIPIYDYIVMNGVFTQKRDLSFEEMFDFLKQMIRIIFEKAKIGVAFNVMSPQVDWKNEENFHLSFDLLADFLAKEVSRKYLFKHDYGLYEYTTYINK